MQPNIIAQQFLLEGTPVQYEAFGHGHINQTYRVTTDAGKCYILQLINRYVFTNPPQLMENACRVTEFIREKGNFALHFLPTRDGTFCFMDDVGEYWRCCEFVEGLSLDAPESPEDFYQSARAFGQFQEQLTAFPADTLYETIPNFHNTIDRYRQLKESIAADKQGRLASSKAETAFYLAQEPIASRLQQMRENGALPLRVTHNDTKLNNVILNKDTREPLCVLDLDTVMPGLSAYDYGDSIRFGAATAVEDEPDASKMKLDIPLFCIYTKGFLEAAPSLTDAEVEALPLGALTMTLECGCRFLKDFLDGDIYFKTAYPTHNLVRCRTQMALAADILAHWDEMSSIVRELALQVRG